MSPQKFILLWLSSLFLCFSIPVIAEDVEDQIQTEAAQIQEVNINTADAETMAKHLKGIGLKRAASIVAYRESNGKFYSAEELMYVRGIGKHIIQMNEGRIVVDAVAADAVDTAE